MARDTLILDRYEPLGVAGTGGFGTVQIAWDPRIQRKVAIKTIHLTELDAYRAKLPGAQAAEGPAPVSAAERWHGALPWEDDPADNAESELGERAIPASSEAGSTPGSPADAPADGMKGLPTGTDGRDGGRSGEPMTSLAHLPGLDEARTAAMLDDPRIVTVYDFEVRERTAYLIMEYVEGITLTHLLHDFSDGITLDMVTAVFDAVAGALMTAHESGVLHLDIKPDNIIITPQGQAKVTDFGLATLADASGVGTTGGGTIGYMPLEQMRREHLDARTDEWSLAALAYEMLTGANPFRAATLDEAEAAILNAELVLPSLCWDDIDEQIDDVVFFALDPNVDERYASIADFAEEMDKFLGDAGRGQDDLAYAVSEALGLLEDEPVDEEYSDWGESPNTQEAQRGTPALPTIFSGLFAQSDSARSSEFDDDYDFEDEDDFVEEAETPKRRAREPRVPLGERYSSRTLSVLAHLFAISSSAAIAFLAVVNTPFLDMLGPVQPILVTVIVAACAIAAVIRPHIGALAAYCLLGVSFVACWHPIVGAVLVIATVAWWYTVGHESMAASNVALLGPLAGAIGGASAVPIIAGAACKPLAAVATTAFTALVSLLLASLGTGSLAGWDAFLYWNYTSADISANLIGLLTQPLTWATIAGWLAASAVLALARNRGGRGLSIAALVIAAVAVAAGPIVLSGPTPQLVISVAAATLAVLAVLV